MSTNEEPTKKRKLENDGSSNDVKLINYRSLQVFNTELQSVQIKVVHNLPIVKIKHMGQKYWSVEGDALIQCHSYPVYKTGRLPLHACLYKVLDLLRDANKKDDLELWVKFLWHIPKTKLHVDFYFRSKHINFSVISAPSDSIFKATAMFVQQI